MLEGRFFFFKVPGLSSDIELNGVDDVGCLYQVIFRAPKAFPQVCSEPRSCVKVEVAVLGLGSTSLIVLMVFVDVKQH